ncbi:MAG TPA: lipase family protein [Stellaceae bacterium]|nr:lipase family protein [Stellaceae bacterium]
MRSTFWLALAACLSAASAAAQALPKTPAEALAMEQEDRLPPSTFYDVPSPLPLGKPGELIRSEPADDYALPRGASAVRILYHSQNATGGDVATSGVVLIPRGVPPETGWPVIAWAHGTTGVARICGPSTMKDVYYGDEGLFPMVEAGFAVVATDYAGLGTAGPHQYVSKPAQVHDVIDAIPAARAAVPRLGRKWVVDGHNQGGLTAWGVAEAEAGIKDPDYLGAVSVAGAADLHAILERMGGSADAGFYLRFMAYGVHARFPEFKPSSMLADAALAKYDDVTSKGCWFYAYAVALADKGPQLRPGWDQDPSVQQFLAENALGERPIFGPLLVITGDGDKTVPVESVRATVAKACKAGIPVDFKVYPGLDHDPTMTNSTPDQLRWIKDRFAGKPAAPGCGDSNG